MFGTSSWSTARCIRTASEVAPADGQCVVPLQNRYSFTDLAELTCRWQALAGEKVLASGESHIAAKPRSSVDASFPATPGMDTLRLEFIHPDGRSVYVDQLAGQELGGIFTPLQGARTNDWGGAGSAIRGSALMPFTRFDFPLRLSGRRPGREGNCRLHSRHTRHERHNRQVGEARTSILPREALLTAGPFRCG